MNNTIETPWGKPDSSEEIAPGIVRHDTPSHGGYYVAPERVAEMPEPLRDFKPFAGPNWYEEDCDWCIVALAFPQLFPAEYAPAAMETLKHYRPKLFQQFTQWQRGKAATKPMTHDELRKRHYERLNDYRNSVEYQASPCCYEKLTGELKTLLGDRWEIDEEIYDDFLNMLPPLGWRGGAFYMCEFCFDNITTKFSKEGGKFYCEFARYPAGRAAA